MLRYIPARTVHQLDDGGGAFQGAHSTSAWIRLQLTNPLSLHHISASDSAKIVIWGRLKESGRNARSTYHENRISYHRITINLNSWASLRCATMRISQFISRQRTETLWKVRSQDKTRFG
jgi:hypothetical protein